MLVVNWRLNKYPAQKDQQASFAHADSQMSKFILLDLLELFLSKLHHLIVLNLCGAQPQPEAAPHECATWRPIEAALEVSGLRDERLNGVRKETPLGGSSHES